MADTAGDQGDPSQDYDADEPATGSEVSDIEKRKRVEGPAPSSMLHRRDEADREPAH
jgi:hypothetical protein